MLFRLWFLFTYCDLAEVLIHYKRDLLLTFWHGFRCDTVVLSFALMPVFVFYLLGLLFYIKPTLGAGYNRFLHFFSNIYFIILFIAIFWICIVDFFYYRNFQAHFDSRVFGIVEDGAKEVMASVWSDYPVITLSLVFVIALVGWIKIIKFIQLIEKPFSYFNTIFAHIVTAILAVGLLLLGARSSLSTFPFRKNDLVFSSHLRLNDAAANGVFMLKEAISDRMEYSLRLKVSDLLPAHGYNSIEEAKNDWNAGKCSDNCNFFCSKTTPYHSFLTENPPNIVLIVMEGWSSNLFNYHSNSFNLLGALGEQLPHLIHFPFCFPVNFGTISALETFFTNNVGPALSLSEYATIPLNSSTVLAFQKRNYETSYYTSGYNGWRNIGRYCRTQGFENVRGAEFIKTLCPRIETTNWGVFDQYLFSAILDKLHGDNPQPQFLIGMTTTNHSPHKIPKNYLPKSIVFPDSLLSRITTNKNQTLSSLETFQYVNDCLGKFLDSLRSSPAGESTIVVVTGDHVLTGGFSYPSSEFVHQWSVPLLFYIPKHYLPQSIPNTHRLVSHKDILPTIYNIAFSEYKYEATGDNVFDPTTEADAFVVTQYTWALGKAGGIRLDTKQSFQWQGNGLLLQPHELTTEIERLRRKANAWLFGMKWQIYIQCEK